MNMSSLPAPQSVTETGIPRVALEDLALKTLYLFGEMWVNALAQELKLGMPIVEELFQRLRQDRLVEVKGMTGNVHRIATTSLGKDRATELLARSLYVGAAPITLEDYVTVIEMQSVKNITIGPADVEKAFKHLVIDDTTIEQLGMSVIAGNSLFLYGPSGTGKTSIAEAMQKVYPDSVFIPYAIEVDGQIIKVFDSAVHEVVEADGVKDSDLRFVRCKRPKVITGGDLTIDMLDLQFDAVSKFYVAPLQVKANNGVLIVDDFGRQRVSPIELLNRWIVPLDRGVDYLTLSGGKKFQMPFDLLVIFSTNLNPSSLADEAFMRRIHNKILIDHVTRDQFRQISIQVCQAQNVQFTTDAIEYLMDVITNELQEPLRPCYPRDIVKQICSVARYRSLAPTLCEETVRTACRNYFLAH